VHLLKSVVLLWMSVFILGGLGAWIVRQLAGRFGLIDSPTERSSHLTPTPRGGGVGIMAAFLVLALAEGVLPAVWFPLSALSLFAFLGDRIEIPPKWRLLVQGILMGILVLGNMQSGSQVGFTSVLIFVFWVVFLVGTTNFYNFMDGINGLAGITGVSALALMAGFIYGLEGASPYFMMTVGVALACLGFLPFNIPSARVFMGDIGSIFLGGLFGSLTYIHSRSLVDFLCMISFLFPFYADEMTSMVVRLKDGENLTRPHRRHLYQILTNEKHIPHWQVSVVYGLVQIGIGLSILFSRSAGWPLILILLGIYFAAFTGASYFLRASLTQRAA
jgi:Fuc2NAc and GlcNAc transferase